MKTADRLTDLVRRRNRELAFDAALKASLGVGFTLVTFGLLYWIAWFIGVFVARSIGLHAWQFGVIITGIFLGVATWSAWRRVDPLADLEPLTDEQALLTLISQATPGMLYFSPRHASAGLAIVLIGGPASIIEAFGIWAHRIRADAALFAEAACLLESCDPELPANQVRNLHAAFLLRRLALIKVTPRADSKVLTLTDQGFAALSKATSKAKRKRGDERSSERQAPEAP